MIETKLFEILDRATFIPVIATRIQVEIDRDTLENTDEVYLLRRAGYGGHPCVLLTRLVGGSKAVIDPDDWGDRTMTTAHNYIEENWGTIKTGDVVDVEFILGETQSAKLSERITNSG
jgi:hypothetical protein